MADDLFFLDIHMSKTISWKYSHLGISDRM